MKKIYLVFLMLCGSSAFGEIIDRTVAVVGKEVILQSDVDALLKNQVSGITSREDALNTLKDKFVLESECKKQGFYATPSDIKSSINDIKKQNNLDDAALALELQKIGTTIAAYESQLYYEFCKSRFIQGKIRNRINITKDDVKRAYEQKYVTEAEKRLRLRDMLVKPKSEKLIDLSKAKALAHTILKTLEEGKTWEEVLEASQKADGPSVASENLGTLKRSDLMQSIADSVFSDSTGKFRGPIETGDGFHVLEVLEKVEAAKIPLVDVEKDLHKQLFEKEVERLLKKNIEEARASYDDASNFIKL